MNNPITSNQELNERMKELLGLDAEVIKEVNVVNEIKEEENNTMSKFATPKGLKTNINNTSIEMPTIPTIPNPQSANVTIGDINQQNAIPRQEVVNSIPIMNMHVDENKPTMPTIPIEHQQEVEEDTSNPNNLFGNQQVIQMAMPQVIIEEKEVKPKNQAEALNYDEIHKNLMDNYMNMTNEEKFRLVLQLASRDTKRIKTPGTVAGYIGKSVNSRRVLDAVNGKKMDGYKTQKAIEFFWTNEALLKYYPDVLQKVVQLDLFSWKNPEKK